MANLTGGDHSTPFEQAKAELRDLGIELVSTPGAYRFRYIGRGPATALLPESTEDIEGAIRIGRALAGRVPSPPQPPLGPTGRRNTRRSQMYRHNRKIATKRRRKAQSIKPSPSGHDDKTE
jgi:hypothetical protein